MAKESESRFDGLENVKVREVVAPGREALVQRIVDDMARDGLDWHKSWTSPEGVAANGMPMNPLSGARYRGFNALRLMNGMMEIGSCDPRFVTAKQAFGAGMSIEKDAEPFYMEKWKSDRFVVSKTTGKAIKPQPRGKAAWAKALKNPDNMVMNTRAKLVSYFTVYNASQVKGMEPLEEAIGRTPGRELSLEGEQLVDFLEAASPVMVTETQGDRAFYSSAKDAIWIPLREQFDDAGALARTLLHEQVHATGHPTRLDRKQNNSFGSKAYAFEELVAEVGSMMCALEMGVTLPLVGDDLAEGHSTYWDDHIAYLQGWAAATKDDQVRAVMRAANQAGYAADWLMDNCFGEPLAEISRGLEEEREVENPSLTKTAEMVGRADAGDRDAETPTMDSER